MSLMTGQSMRCVHRSPMERWTATQEMEPGMFDASGIGPPDAYCLDLAQVLRVSGHSIGATHVKSGPE